MLPVFFYIPGGGLNKLSDANNNGSELILAADKDMVIVTINYRVEPYGFLASSEVQKNGIINAGVHDQRKALEWVHTNIRKVKVCHNSKNIKAEIYLFIVLG